MIISTTGELEKVCRRLLDAGTFALDTEFVRERTYYIRLGIIQVAAKDMEAILDPRSIGTLEPFFELVCDRGIEKIVHAGEQDFEAFFERNGEPPNSVFDTQVAAAMVGYGDQIAYAKLVEEVTGVKLSKLETLTDWMARPLTPHQITYALDDVRYLLALRKHLGRRLKALGREEWVREEFRRLEDRATYAPVDPHEAYKRIKVRGLNDVQRGVLREVAAWREREAMRRNLPRAWVMRDQPLIQIARQKPDSVESLRQVRAMKRRELGRSSADLLAAVARGLSAPAQSKSSRARVPGILAQAKPLRKLLQAWVYAHAAKAKIAPSVLTSRAELKALVEGHLREEIPALPVLTGWRQELVGRELLDILAGKLKVAIDPDTGELRGTGEQGEPSGGNL